MTIRSEEYVLTTKISDYKNDNYFHQDARLARIITNVSKIQDHKSKTPDLKIPGKYAKKGNISGPRNQLFPECPGNIFPMFLGALGPHGALGPGPMGPCALAPRCGNAR